MGMPVDQAGLQLRLNAAAGALQVRRGEGKQHARRLVAEDCALLSCSTLSGLTPMSMTEYGAMNGFGGLGAAGLGGLTLPSINNLADMHGLGSAGVSGEPVATTLGCAF